MQPLFGHDADPVDGLRRAALLDVAKAKASAAGLVSSEGGAAAAQTRMAIVHDFFDPKDPSDFTPWAATAPSPVLVQHPIGNPKPRNS